MSQYNAFIQIAHKYSRKREERSRFRSKDLENTRKNGIFAHENSKLLLLMKKIFTTFVLLVVATCAAFAEYQITSTKEYDGYKSYVINYTSVGADCVTPATISGVITVPTENLMGTAVWVIDNHHTFADNASAPSVAGSTPAGLGGFSKNFVMIATDYL